MFQRILVPVDGSPTSEFAVGMAASLCHAFGARLRLVHVVEETAYLTGYDPFGGASGALLKSVREAGVGILKEAAQSARKAGVEAETQLYDKFGERLGDAVAAAATQWEADLIVTGTHGRRGLERMLLGSGAEQVIRLAPVPVLAVRAPESVAQRG